MRKILSFALALVLLAFVFAGCNGTDETNGNSSSENDSILGNKTVEQVYGDAMSALKSMDNYELCVTQIYETDFTGDTIRSQSVFEYKRSGNTAYVKNPNSSSKELWFVNGVMYSSDNKEKINTSLDAFLTNYFIDISNILIDIKSEELEDKEFTETDGIYTLSIKLSPQMYEEYAGASLGESTVYNVSFDSKGNLCSVEMNTEVAASNNAWVIMITKFDFKNIGSTAPINPPEDAENYLAK